MTLIEVITEYAPLYTATANATATESQIARAGVRCFRSTRFQKFEAGIPPSREKPYTTREHHVTADNPQNHMAMTTSAENRVPARSPNARCRIAITTGTSLPSEAFALSTPGMSGIASVRANNSRYPTTLDTTTAIIIP